MVIREAGEADIDGVWQLEMSWAAENIMPRPYRPTSKEELRGYSRIEVAEENGRIVGHACGDERTSDGSKLAVLAAGSRYLEIEGVYVLPAFRGRGIGGELLETLVARAKREGVNDFLLFGVSRNLGRVQSFYRAHGFERVVPPDEYRMLRRG